MKIKHKQSGNIIDVPNEHALILLNQGWQELQEVKVEKKVIKEDSKQVKRGRK